MKDTDCFTNDRAINCAIGFASVMVAQKLRVISPIANKFDLEAANTIMAHINTLSEMLSDCNWTGDAADEFEYRTDLPDEHAVKIHEYMESVIDGSKSGLP